MKIQHAIESKSYAEYLTTMVELFCAMGIEHKYRMGQKELMFFVASLELVRDGIPLDSTLATKRLSALFPEAKEPEQRVYQYRMKLKKKKKRKKLHHKDIRKEKQKNEIWK